MLIKVLILLALATIPCLANFQEGDFIPTARKAQFHGNHKTNWHDVLGAHCPRFGVESLTLLPLPEPVGFQETDDYRVQFSYDADRVVTPWLQVLGRRAPSIPFIDVELVQSGNTLVAVSASVKKVPPEDSSRHPLLVSDFKNASHWPKHLLIRYRWTVQHEVDVDRGLIVLFSAGCLMFFFTAIGTMRSYSTKLKQFMADVGGENINTGPAGGGNMHIGGAGGGFTTRFTVGGEKAE